MTKKHYKYIFLGMSLSVILFAAQASAALVTCGLSGIETCTWNDLYPLINAVITFLIEIGLLLTTIAIVVTGAQLVWSPSSSTAHSVWKSRLQIALLGLVIMLTAFLIVKAIVWGLTGGETKVDNYNLRNVLIDK